MNKTQQSLISASCDVQIPFYDLDPMCIVWHGNYVKYLERGRGVLLDKLQYNCNQMEASGYYWPIIDMQLKYIKPARFDQVITITASLMEYEHRLKINYLLTDKDTGLRMVRAQTTQVAVEIASNEMQLASPTVLLKKVEGLLAC